MKRKIAVGASLLILAGCSTPTPEEQFVSDFREAMVIEAGISDNRIVLAGKSLCDVYYSLGMEETIDFLMEFGAKSEDDAVDVIASAERHIC